MSLPVYKFALREDIKDDKRFLPTRAEPKATGWDVRAAMSDKKPMFIKPFQHVKIPLGFRGFCPEGWWYELKPRSSTFGKKNLHALYGTIDETYEGELVFACQFIPTIVLKEDYPIEAGSGSSDYNNYGKFLPDKFIREWMNQTIEINFGDAIGQLIPIKRQEMETVEITNEEIDQDYKERDSVRKDGGFGSTGT